MQTVARFANSDAATAPLNLTAPFTRRNWLARAPDIRLATIRTNITKQVTARHIERHARRVAEAEATAPAEDAPAPAPASRYVVACISGCGTFHPATSGRPVIVACGAREKAEAQNKQNKLTSQELSTAELSARLRREAAASESAPTLTKARKKRRRATCSNTRKSV